MSKILNQLLKDLRRNVARADRSDADRREADDLVYAINLRTVPGSRESREAFLIRTGQK